MTAHKFAPLSAMLMANQVAATLLPARRIRESPMKAHLAIVVSAVMLFAPLAQAMEIRQFDRMSGDDQIKYIDKLTDSVEDASKNDPALLARVKRFVMNKQPGEAISGMGRFELNLSLARIGDLQAAEKNPKARRLEVEDVMYATLARSGIVLNKSFRPGNFQPQKPLAQKFLTREDADKALAQTQAWIARTAEPEHSFSHGGPQTEISAFTNNEANIRFFSAMGINDMTDSRLDDGYVPPPTKLSSSGTGPCYLAPYNDPCNR